jgi:hypothetical protein
MQGIVLVLWTGQACMPSSRPDLMLSLIMEVDSRLAEGAADAVVQGKCSLQNLVAQLLHILLEALEVSLQDKSSTSQSPSKASWLQAPWDGSKAKPCSCCVQIIV